jgi:hypothetical protein
MKSGRAHAIVRLEWPAHELEERVIESGCAFLAPGIIESILGGIEAASR